MTESDPPPPAVPRAVPRAVPHADVAADLASGPASEDRDAPTSAPAVDDADADDSPPTMHEIVADLLRDGPATSAQLAARIESAHPGLLGAREGFLLPLLLELQRRGTTGATWADLPPGRRRLHFAHGAAPPDAGGAAAPVRPRRIASAAMRRVADEATEKLAFAPGLAEDLRAEILAHLLDAAATAEVSGRSRAEAETDAVHRFGDTWRVATDLSRAARGRRTVLFPRNALESVQSLAIYDTGVIVAILAAIGFVRFQVVAAYHIPTKSMEPTLHGDRTGGDKILVLHQIAPPKRFDIEVFDGWGPERNQYVKRCGGLPGERISLLEGDLWVDGRLIRKEGDALDALLFPIFDAAAERRAAAASVSAGDGHDGADERDAKTRFLDRWDYSGGTKWEQYDDGSFRVDAGAEAPPAVLRWRDRLTDGLYDTRTAELDDGLVDVGDGRIEADVTPLDEASRIVLRWARGASRFEAVLRGGEPGVAISADSVEVVRRADVSLPVGRATRVRFSHVDHVLRLDVDGDEVLRFDLPEPSPPRTSAPSAEPSVRVLAGRARIDPVRLERDVHWTPEYENVPRERLGPDDFFMLGDNSSNSQDSRARGPVHRNRLRGRPVLIVWPLSRFGIPR